MSVIREHRSLKQTHERNKQKQNNHLIGRKYIKLYKVDEVKIYLPTYLPTYRPAYLIYRNLLLSQTITHRSKEVPSRADGADSNLHQSGSSIIREPLILIFAPLQSQEVGNNSWGGAVGTPSGGIHERRRTFMSE